MERGVCHTHTHTTHTHTHTYLRGGGGGGFHRPKRQRRAGGGGGAARAPRVTTAKTLRMRCLPNIAYVIIRQHTCTARDDCEGAPQVPHTSAHVIIPGHELWRGCLQRLTEDRAPATPAPPQPRPARGQRRSIAPAEVAGASAAALPRCIHQLTSAYVSIRQHTSEYISIRQHTSAYVSIRQLCRMLTYAMPCRRE
jgi:hypothetical protein